jgi:hypothetical protein
MQDAISTIRRKEVRVSSICEGSETCGAAWAEAGIKSFAAVSEGVQAIAAEASEYARRGIEMGGVATEELLSATSLETVIGVQAAFARRSYEAFVTGAVRLGDLYAELARDSYKPFESVAATAR